MVFVLLWIVIVMGVFFNCLELFVNVGIFVMVNDVVSVFIVYSVCWILFGWWKIWDGFKSFIFNSYVLCVCIICEMVWV